MAFKALITLHGLPAATLSAPMVIPPRSAIASKIDHVVSHHICDKDNTFSAEKPMVVDNTQKDKLTSIAERLRSCRSELESIKGELFQAEYEKVRRELNTAISACNRAGKEITELKPLEGQMDIFDMLNEDMDKE